MTSDKHQAKTELIQFSTFSSFVFPRFLFPKSRGDDRLLHRAALRSSAALRSAVGHGSRLGVWLRAAARGGRGSHRASLGGFGLGRGWVLKVLQAIGVLLDDLIFGSGKGNGFRLIKVIRKLGKD